MLSAGPKEESSASAGTGYYAGHAPRVDSVHVPIAPPKTATAADLESLASKTAGPSEEGGATLRSSEWNALSGSWHWEERDETAWFLGTLRERLIALPPVEGKDSALVRVASVEMKEGGNCAVNVRKGKKIVTFDLSLTIGWAGSCVVGRAAGVDAAPVVRVEGEQRLTDVCEDDSGGSDSSSWTISKPTCEMAKGGGMEGTMAMAVMDRVVRKKKLLAAMYRKKLAPAVVRTVAECLQALKEDR